LRDSLLFFEEPKTSLGPLARLRSGLAVYPAKIISWTSRNRLTLAVKLQRQRKESLVFTSYDKNNNGTLKEKRYLSVMMKKREEFPSQSPRLYPGIET
jgi:hypothetical protein